MSAAANMRESCAKSFPTCTSSTRPGTGRTCLLTRNELVAKHAPYLLDLYRGITDVIPQPPPAAAKPPAATAALPPAPGQAGGTNSFAVSGIHTLSGRPLSGQSKCSPLHRLNIWSVVRMRMSDGPSMIFAAFPGELVGYGFWSTGMSLFRNAIPSSGICEKGIQYTVMTMLLRSCKTVDEAAALIEKYGRKSKGTATLCDAQGGCLSIETNGGGNAILKANNGISIHTNHAVVPKIAAVMKFETKDIEANSFFRYDRLAELIESEKGKLTPQKAMSFFADHTGSPDGLCRHADPEGNNTTMAVVAEPTLGLLHVVKGYPCCNWAATYTI